MKSTPLEQLASEPIQLLSACLSTASALRRGLARSAEVRAVREAVETGALTEGMMRAFVSGLMAELTTGESFAHDHTLSALAVVLEPLDLSFAEEFLQDLSRLRLAEMGMSVRVARECLKHRSQQSVRTKGMVTAQVSRNPVAISERVGNAGDGDQELNGHPEQSPRDSKRGIDGDRGR